MDPVETTDTSGDTESVNSPSLTDGIDFSNFGMEAEETPAQPEQSGEPAGPADEGQYPSTWDSILGQIPEAFHAAIAPELKKWDQGVSSRFQQIHEQYAPYKQFQEQQISPEDIQAAMGLYQNIGSDPVNFFERYRDALLEQGLIEEAQEVQDAIEGEEDDDYSDESNPVLQELQELRQWRDNFEQQFTEQQQAEQTASMQQQANQEIDSEFSALEGKYGTLSPAYRREIAEKAWVLQQQTGKPVSLEAAHQELMRFVNRSRAASPGANAPRVAPGGGGLPNRPAPDYSNESERISAAEDLVRNMLNS